MEYVITRTWYCPHCKKEGSPKRDDMFILFGHTEREPRLYKVGRTKDAKHHGYTPHIIKLERVLRGERKVRIIVTCAIVDCGVWIQEDMENESYKFGFNYPTRYTMSLDDWVALKGFKGSELYIY